jgi:hypothetical protein
MAQWGDQPEHTRPYQAPDPDHYFRLPQWADLIIQLVLTAVAAGIVIGALVVVILACLGKL